MYILFTCDQKCTQSNLRLSIPPPIPSQNKSLSEFTYLSTIKNSKVQRGGGKPLNLAPHGGNVNVITCKLPALIRRLFTPWKVCQVAVVEPDFSRNGGRQDVVLALSSGGP